MLEVQSTDAKSRLSELLMIVELGETIAITRHGKVVAYLHLPLSMKPAGKKRRYRVSESIYAHSPGSKCP